MCLLILKEILLASKGKLFAPTLMKMFLVMLKINQTELIRKRSTEVKVMGDLSWEDMNLSFGKISIYFLSLTAYSVLS